MLRSLVIAIFLAGSTFAQDAETIELPDSVMRQVIGRIARYKFKPTRNPRTIPVAKPHVKAEWLPNIPNLTFLLVPEDEIYDYAKGVLLVEDLTREGSIYSINVGWGDLECDASGETWKFTIHDERVRLWPTKDGWGRGCGGNAPPVIRGLKLGEESPNELRGYEFFKRGKLKNIRLGISTREDIKLIFGETCEGSCEYDDRWSIWAHYFDDNDTFTQTTTSDKEEVATEFSAKPEMIGTLKSIDLIPKEPIPFQRIVFPRVFVSGSSYAIGDAWDANGFAGAVHTSIDDYADGYGLTYKIYNEETFNNLKHPEEDRKPPKKGDLIEIEYRIPDSLNDKIYNKTVLPATKK